MKCHYTYELREIMTACTRFTQNPMMGWGTVHKISPLAEKLLIFDSRWEVKS